jgi:alkanesulfonate monooxygenase SsuD/methylene tetrahydromethanopterin reductase-like flavin-dependent oxidoreductase (luciferase family)
VKFGIFYEISVPRPWTPEREKEVYDNCLEQVVLADQLGFDTVWAVEHHFLEEYSHCSAPEIYLTACAMKTQRIRVGHGIVVCVPEINHPIRIAERAAVLDIVSGGRLEFGTGRSATWTELGGFRANPDTTKATWDEFCRAVPKMWTQERYAHDGIAFSMPSRAVLPKPYQKPHPPMWVAVTSPGTELDAADRGMGALGLTFADFPEQERKGKVYRQRIRSCDPVGQVVNDQIAAVNFLFCHQDDAEGVRTGQRLAGTFGYLAAQLVSARETYPSRGYASFGLLPQLRRPQAAPGGTAALPPGLCVGNPERVTKTLKSWESSGVDAVNFLLNAGETVPQEQVLQSLRTFAKDVMPHFRKPEAA